MSPASYRAAPPRAVVFTTLTTTSDKRKSSRTTPRGPPPGIADCPLPALRAGPGATARGAGKAAGAPRTTGRRPAPFSRRPMGRRPARGPPDTTAQQRGTRRRPRPRPSRRRPAVPVAVPAPGRSCGSRGTRTPPGHGTARSRAYADRPTAPPRAGTSPGPPRPVSYGSAAEGPWTDRPGRERRHGPRGTISPAGTTGATRNQLSENTTRTTRNPAREGVTGAAHRNLARRPPTKHPRPLVRERLVTPEPAQARADRDRPDPPRRRALRRSRRGAAWLGQGRRQRPRGAHSYEGTTRATPAPSHKAPPEPPEAASNARVATNEAAPHAAPPRPRGPLARDATRAGATQDRLTPGAPPPGPARTRAPPGPPGGASCNGATGRQPSLFSPPDTRRGPHGVPGRGGAPTPTAPHAGRRGASRRVRPPPPGPVPPRGRTRTVPPPVRRGGR